MTQFRGERRKTWAAVLLPYVIPRAMNMRASMISKHDLHLVRKADAVLNLRVQIDIRQRFGVYTGTFHIGQNK